MNTDSGLVVRVLGELCAARGGTHVDLGGRRQRAVLAALVIARGQVVPAGRLAECVWGDDAPERTAGALQSYVSHLRRRLEPDADARSRNAVIASAGPGYALRLGPDAVDAWRFEEAVAAATDQPPAEAVRTLDGALRLWRGPAFAEYGGEPWADTEIARLSELRSVAVERLLAARLDVDDPALIVGELEALVAGDPLREERWRLLVLALYRAQRQADALAALRRARDTLADALGVDPGPALRALEQEVLSQSPALDRTAATHTPSAVGPDPDASTPATSRAVGPAGGPGEAPGSDRAGPGAAPAPGPENGSGGPDPIDLVDRGREVAVLQQAVDDVRSGEGRLVLIQGPAGIGKTRLLVEATRMARGAGCTSISARGSRLERSFAFGAVRQLFESTLGDHGHADRLLAGAAASARNVFAQVDDNIRPEGSYAVLHGLYWLTVHLSADGPLLLAVDDVQWCDSASLRWLAYLVKRLEDLPVLVIATLRTGDILPHEALLDELALEPAATVLRPRPLTPAAVDRLVRHQWGEAADPFVAACHATTSGNPLLLRQLLRALQSEDVRPDVAHTDTVRAVGSRAVSSLIMLRLRRMPDDAIRVAHAVAVLGPRADLPTVAALARMAEGRTAAVIDLLVRNEVLRDEQPLVFVHPLVRDAVYEDLPTAERGLSHERAAHLLTERAEDAEQIAAHLLVAPRRGSGATVATLRAAARTAMARGASESAVVLLRRALDEPVLGRERVDVLVELGRVESLLDGPSAVGHLGEAYGFVDDPRERAAVAVVMARTHVFASPPGVATAFAREAAAALPPELDDARQGLLALQRITGFMHGLPPSAYRDGSQPRPSGDGDGARMLAATLAYERLLDATDRPGAVELARFALSDDYLLEADNGLLWVVAANVLVLSDAGLGDFWERALERAHATGSLFSVLSVNVWRGFTRWREGRLADALQSLCDAAEQQRMWGGSVVGATYAAAFTAGVLLDMGDPDAAERTLVRARRLGTSGEGPRLVREMTTRLLLAQGRPGEALDELATAIDPLGIVNPVWASWRGLKAQALAALGMVDEARMLLAEEIALLRRWGAPSALGPALRVAGEVAGAAGLPLLREAVAVLAPTRSHLELARARLALGVSPDVSDRDALPLLRSAFDGARTCGARGVQRAASAALAARGDDTPATCEEPGGLTERHQQVLALTNAGLDVHAIAQRLYLTPGTVRTALHEATTRRRAGAAQAVPKSAPAP